MIGRVIGKYRVLEEIGRGGMGCVYRARHVKFERLAAIKHMRLERKGEPEDRERLMEEQLLLAELRHPVIAALQGLLVEDSDLFLVWEHVPGVTLEELLLAQGPLSIEQVVFMGRQLLSALAHAQEHGVLHGHIKPSNIMLTSQAVKLVDLGTARCFDVANLTLPGTVMGSPVYLPPERWESAPTGPRSDVYSLGCCLFEALAGRPPHVSGGGGWRAYHRLHTLCDMPDVRKLREDTPPWLAEAILKATRRPPAMRYAGAVELHEVFRKQPEPQQVRYLPSDEELPLGERHTALLRRQAEARLEDTLEEELPTEEHRTVLIPLRAKEALLEDDVMEDQRTVLMPSRGLRAEPTLPLLPAADSSAGSKPAAKAPAARVPATEPPAADPLPPPDRALPPRPTLLPWLLTTCMALLLAVGLLAALGFVYATRSGGSGSAMTLQLENLQAQPMELECSAGSSGQTWRVEVPASSRVSITIPGLPATCSQIHRGEAQQIWTMEPAPVGDNE